jgi:hypothetical protein
MKLHIANGFKAARDRAVLINSYHVMCKDFRIPKDRRLDDADLARLSNEMLFKLNSDLYSQATVKQAKRLAVKMGLLESPIRRVVSWFKYTFKEAASAKS